MHLADKRKWIAINLTGIKRLVDQATVDDTAIVITRILTLCILLADKEQSRVMGVIRRRALNDLTILPFLNLLIYDSLLALDNGERSTKGVVSEMFFDGENNGTVR